jgi:hypothetical protein
VSNCRFRPPLMALAGERADVLKKMMGTVLKSLP